MPCAILTPADGMPYLCYSFWGEGQADLALMIVMGWLAIAPMGYRARVPTCCRVIELLQIGY